MAIIDLLHAEKGNLLNDCPAGKVRATVSALAGGAALGFGFREIVGVYRPKGSAMPGPRSTG